jgi:CBS domain containing-hemolysin-like protein
MGSLEMALRLVGGVLLTGANAFFVVTEFALTRLPQLDPADDPPGLERARRITDQLEIYLTGCQLGITTSSILLGVVAEPAFTYLLQPLFALAGTPEGVSHAVSVVVGIVLINLIHKIWGEQTPTYLGVERPRQVARRTAWALQGWTTIAYPFIMAGDGLAKGTLRLFGIEVQRSWTEAEEASEEPSPASVSAVRREIGEVLSRANLSRERTNEILRAVEIEEIPARRIMVPWPDAVALSTAADLHETLQRMRTHPHDRYPLLGDERDVVGVLYMTRVFRHLPELERGDTTLVDIAEPPVWVDPDLPVSDLIDRLQQEQQELALVREGDRLRGLVTATDAFEAIAGELEDPEDVDRREAADRAAAPSAQRAPTSGRPTGD